MTHEEFVADCLSKLRAAAARCSSGSSDPIDACLEICDLASQAGERADWIVEMFSGIESDLDDLPRGDALALASESFRAEAEKKKAHARDFYGRAIREKCAQIVKTLDQSAEGARSSSSDL